MKILVVSDTHGRTDSLHEIINTGGFDTVFHLGDHAHDAEGLMGVKLYSVRGNCDRISDAPESLAIELGGVRVLLTHGHRYGVKSDPLRLIYAAREAGARVCCFGHTHFPEIFEENGVLFVNPGSLSLPPGGYPPSYAVLSIEDGEASASLVGIYEGGLCRPLDLL